MAGRPTQKKANIEALKKVKPPVYEVDLKPMTVYIMRSAGCTFAEIAKVYDITRQMAETLYKEAAEQYENN